MPEETPYRGVQVEWGGREIVKRVFSQWGRWGKTSVKTFSNLFLKTLTEGAVTAEAGSLCGKATKLLILTMSSTVMFIC